MSDLYIWSAVAIIALVTTALRFLPFMVFNANKKTPKIIDKLGKALPYAIMGMLVVYCLKDTNFKAVSNYLPECIGCLIVAVLYVWKRNTLLSIISGTISYMILVQIVF